MPDFRLQSFQDLLVLKNLKASLGSGAADCIPSVAVAVSEGSAISNRSIKSGKYFFCYQSNSERKISCTQAFSQNHHVWNDFLLFNRKHSARSPKTGHDFVHNQQCVSPVAPFPNGPQGPRRPKTHPTRALYQRFNHKCRNVSHVSRREGIQRRHVSNLNGGKTPMGRSDLEHGERTEAACACGIAMLTALEGHVPMLSGTSQPPILRGDP